MRLRPFPQGSGQIFHRLVSQRDKFPHREFCSHITSDSSLLFLNASGERLSTLGMAISSRSFDDHAGIERHVTPHMMLHTRGDVLLRNGVDIGWFRNSWARFDSLLHNSPSAQHFAALRVLNSVSQPPRVRLSA